MHHSTTTLSLNESLQEMLSHSIQEQDCALLLPLLDSLFEQHRQNIEATEQAYRRVIIKLAAFMQEHKHTGQTNAKQLALLITLTEAGHAAEVLHALSQRLLLPQQAKSATETAAIQSETAADAAASVETKLDFLQNLEAFDEQHALQFNDLLKENHLNDDEIKALKKTLQNRLESTKSQFHEFEKLMQLLLSELQAAKNITELESLRTMLNRSIHNLLSEQARISTNIIDVAHELDQFESHCTQLNHELGLVKQLSMTDELTRLPNRRAFLKRLENESGRVQRYGYPLAVAILDLDLFKEINDTYGHSIGDQVLQTYTQKVLSTFRNYDLVARYGGEEFAVLLPHTDIYGAERAINKVLQKALESSLEQKDVTHTIKLPTFSAGVAVYRDGESIDSIINRADEAMYQAKKMGRNRVVLEGE